jgi:hypothetical protein
MFPGPVAPRELRTGSETPSFGVVLRRGKVNFVLSRGGRT